MRIFKIYLPVIICFLASFSFSKKLNAQTNDRIHDPLYFFEGHTISTGTVKTKKGKRITPIKTETTGIFKDSILYIEQDLYPRPGEHNHRSWKLYRKDAQHLQAKADDISGTAQGELSGNVFTWTFRRKLLHRNVIKHVKMSQTMTLSADGRSMTVHSVLRKFSMVVAEIDEVFVKQ